MENTKKETSLGGGFWTCEKCGTRISGSSIYHDCNPLPSTEERKTAEEITDDEIKTEASRHFNPEWGGLNGIDSHKAFVLGAKWMRDKASQQTETKDKEIESLTEINNINASKLMEAESQLSEAKKEIEAWKEEYKTSQQKLEAANKSVEYWCYQVTEMSEALKQSKSELSAMRERVEKLKYLLHEAHSNMEWYKEHYPNDTTLDDEKLRKEILSSLKEVNPTKVD